MGAVIAWSATRAMSALLYGVDAGDPLTFATVLGLLAVVAMVGPVPIPRSCAPPRVTDPYGSC
jgi:hypothetical protein